ncbi:MAG: lysine--tRNA ligase [Candidatus Lokiarchaeota archaeon]|nr:lysine--tRNA ligase [Candidatus Lokiarchaeota archaeon]MBD3198584.1 lysine--tRNA ligase [Candidatus Lokiarchaeota archaeon]
MNILNVNEKLNKEFPAHWLQEIVDNINERNHDIITLATGKTPSGHIHIGILREIIICDAIRRVFENNNKNVRFFLFMDSFDAAKRFPDYIERDFQEKHLGKPFYRIPCPFERCGCKSYAYHFGFELISTFENFGIENKVIWSHELYSQKNMQEKIKIALDKTELIKDILKKYILPTLDNEKKEQFLKSQKNWFPVMAECSKCHKIQNKQKDGSIIPNRIIQYSPQKDTVKYKCVACGYEEELSIFSGTLKLNWRVDWPAKWSLFNTTCEPAGKDHCVKGGSYDTGLEICKKVYNYKGPLKVPYEWLRLGERDMKTSKGIVFTPKRYLEMADPEIFRTLILRTNPMKHISFRIEEIPQYYDYYERMENIYYNIEKAETKEEAEFFKFLYPLTKIQTINTEKPERLTLNLLIFLSQIQNILSIEKLYAKAKNFMKKENFEQLINVQEFEKILDRTKNWIDEIKKILRNEKDRKKINNITQKISIFTILDKVPKKIVKELDQAQIKGIKKIRDFIREEKDLKADIIQNKIFQIAKNEIDIKPKKLFQALYKILLGKKYGPRLGPFLVLLDREWLLARLKIEKN